MGRKAKPKKVDAKAKRAPARTSPNEPGRKTRDLAKRLAEALEQQKATAEILRAISSSPTDMQPTFDAIARSAALLCQADLSGVHRFDGELIHFAAQYGRTADEIEAVRQAFPQRPSRASATARCILSAAVVQVLNHHDDPDIVESLRMFRTVLAVPMLREGRPVGSISVVRRVVKPFTDDQIDLLKTFADQAVIAIENVRLFTEQQTANRELTTALEQQTATSQILQVISQSPTDVQPVFDVIAQSAARLCEGYFSVVFVSDGAQLHVAATHNLPRGWLQDATRSFPAPLTGDTQVARAVRERCLVHVADMQEDTEVSAGSRRRAEISGYRTWIAVPMLGSGGSVGAIAVSRKERKPFSDGEVSLLKTFADQAVIAIDNVRLFTELEGRNAELTESLARQTATAEVLGAISHVQTDAQPVFDIIARSARHLCGAAYGQVQLYDGAVIHLVALDSANPEGDDPIRAVYPLRVGDGSAGGRAISTCAVAQIPDLLDDRVYPFRTVWEASGLRSLLAVPMLRDGAPLGTIGIGRVEPGPFSKTQIELLQTFANQAVIAVENARMFREIEEKNRQLEAASQHKSEFLANMSHELRTPLNAIIGFSEVLADGLFGEVNEKQTEYLHDILESGRHLLSLINDILDLSKIEAGRMELEVETFDLRHAIDNALTLVRERASRRGISLEEAVDPRLTTVQADERKVKQVLLNLLSNALKFTPEGGRIDIRAAVHDDVAEISVTDTGVGIAPEHHEAVFEEFRQVGTEARRVEGTGLGLALSRKFVELHGGRIWVKSEMGKGSTFTFTLPMQRADIGLASR